MLKPESYICLKCNYNLTGLSDVGKCPECGSPYSTRALLGVKVPEPGYAKGERLARRIRTILFAVLAFCFLMCGGLASLVVTRPDRAWAIAGVFAIVLVLASVTSYVYEKD